MTSRPAGRHAAFALALALSWTVPACADPARVVMPKAWSNMTYDHEERRIKAEAAFEAVLCGPPAIRRRAYCLQPDDERLLWPAFRAWHRIMWPPDKATLWGGRAPAGRADAPR